MIWILLVLLVGLPIFTRKFIKGPDLRQFDRPTGEVFDTAAEDAQSQLAIHELLRGWQVNSDAARGLRARLANMRVIMDRLSDELVFDGEVLPVNAAGVDAEWVVAKGADPNRRVLVLHGGAFALGTARGHRKLSAQVSQRANAAVLTINYRLFPEHSRNNSIEDSHLAYRWMLAHGPNGAAPARQTLLVGDSAGGNLALALAAWLRDQKLRDQKLRDQKLQEPALLQASAVVAICPTLDSTLSGPSIIYNADQDIVLRDIGRLARRVPHSLLVWMATLIFRMHLADARYSPIFGDLAGLPPTLIHASDTEILLSDAIRYTNKARVAGADVQLQIWRGQVHDWHLLGDGLQAHEQAWQEIGQFFARHS